MAGQMITYQRVDLYSLASGKAALTVRTAAPVVPAMRVVEMIEAETCISNTLAICVKPGTGSKVTLRQEEGLRQPSIQLLHQLHEDSTQRTHQKICQVPRK